MGPSVLIVESGSTRGAHTGARYLARSGWTVGVGSPEREGLAFWSRATSRWHEVPSVAEDHERFLQAVIAAVRAGSYDLVLPAGDAEALALSWGRDRIPTRVSGPDYPVGRRAIDKLELVEAGRQAGLAVPETVVATSEAIAAFSYPAVVKPRFHWLPEYGRAPARVDAARCEDAGAAARAAALIAAAGGEPLLQELVDGTFVNVHVVADRQHRSLVMVQQEGAPLCFPSRAGRRVRAWSVPVEPALADGVAALMRELRWVGFTGVAFLRGADGVPRLNDFNGRLPMMLEGSCATGPNLAAIWAAVETGRLVPAIEDSQPGIRVQWLEGDLRRAFVERRGGLLRDVAGALRFSRGAVQLAAKRDDPLTTLRYCGLLVKRAWRRRRRR